MSPAGTRTHTARSGVERTYHEAIAGLKSQNFAKNVSAHWGFFHPEIWKFLEVQIAFIILPFDYKLGKVFHKNVREPISWDQHLWKAQ